MIRLLQPIWLLALLPVLALAGAYIWAQRRRRVTAVRFSNLELLRDIAPKGLGWRRHAAAGVLIAALAVLAVGMARPSVDIQEPNERATVVLAMDVSLSMMADDVAPTRMEAAKEAAKKFVTSLPKNFNVGLVSFAKSANVVVSPTKDRAQLSTAIDGLEMAAATATGEAVFASLQAIQSVPPEGAQGLAPARIVLLSDGYRTAGRFVEEASAAALAAKVPVSTIAFGTDEGVVEIEGQVTKVPVDRKALAQLAEDTEGRYYEAVSGDELSEVYADMGSSIGYRTVAREIAQWFIGFGMLAAMAAAGMSLLWTSRIP
ncbi:VWA domain-containing protein [Phytomonospora endophytica]|uniref:Ca-activated chloride channel family protein n=1 Tax=Phytomonospora endophytica TaxID=714109 RepID=A0A841FKZ1_9ACTN|nr:VWA domain-containing protein [Phytomonospora endophytica]MBB6033857.1 Ca-activated chloride channel family protein [Phytomonospora endophytica]GIG64624.1 membrane protein [Phytomonospora endophytica]